MPRPRVSSEFIQSPVTSPLVSALRIPAIIATAKNTFTTQDLVTKSANAFDTLSHPATTIIRVGLLSTTADFTSPTNYLLGDGTNGGPIGSIVWVTGAPSSGTKYFVAYEFAKVDADYEPKVFDNFNAVLNEYGLEELDNNGNLKEESYLTAGARLAMDIGQNRLVLAQVKKAGGTPTATDFKNAYTKLENPVQGHTNPFYIIPLLGILSDTDFAQSQTDALAHVLNMRDPQFRRRRILYTGLKPTSTVDSVITKANAVKNSFFVLAANYDPIRLFATPTGSKEVVLDGTFTALAAAAFRSTQKVVEPALNKIIPGSFRGFFTRFSAPQIDNLVDAGAFVMEEESGIIRVVDDITTNIVNEIEIDVTTVEHRDVMISALERRLKEKFQGRAGSLNISTDVEADTDIFLGEERTSGNIQTFTSSQAARAPQSLRKYTVSFSYLPAGKVRDIDVRFSIDLGLA